MMQNYSLGLLVPLLIFVLLATIDATSIAFAVPVIATDFAGDATESFWIGASFMLASCVSVPISSHFTKAFDLKGVVLTLILTLGLGALAGDYADNMGLFLAGRSLQGLGAGGLVALAYTVCITMKEACKPKMMAAICFSTAVGTIGGPFAGAAISHSSTWRWNLRVVACLCVPLSVMVYNSPESEQRTVVAGKRPDYVGVLLFIGSVVPIVVALSLASSQYSWASWQTLAPLTLGSLSLLALVAREIHPSPLIVWGRATSVRDPLLFSMKRYRRAETIVSFAGALLLGMIMYSLLFFLPIYHRVVKQHSRTHTAMLLLPQTALILPCALLVSLLVKRRFSTGQVLLLGWICTSSGVALLTLLDVGKPVSADVLLNLLSGIGISIVLPALHIDVQYGTVEDDPAGGQTLLIALRYLGSTLGLVTVGTIFRHVFRHELETTKFSSMAGNMTQRATMLVYSIHDLPDLHDVAVLIDVTQSALRRTWMVLSLACLIMALASLTTVVICAPRAIDITGGREPSLVAHAPCGDENRPN